MNPFETIATLFIDRMYAAGATLHITAEGYRFRRWAEGTKWRPKVAHSPDWNGYRFEDFEPDETLKNLWKRNKYEIAEHCQGLVDSWIKELEADEQAKPAKFSPMRSTIPGPGVGSPRAVVLGGTEPKR